MNNLNNIAISGNLTDNSDLKYTREGTAVLNFSIANNRTYYTKSKNKETEVSFFECILWGKPAENLCAYLKKGNHIAIIGYIKQDRWKNNEGHNRSKIKIICEKIYFLGQPKQKEYIEPKREDHIDIPFTAESDYNIPIDEPENDLFNVNEDEMI